MARLIPGLAALLCLAAPAFARDIEARIPLAQVLAVAKSYPNLVVQVRLELVRAGVTREAVTCSARRFSSAWAKLTGQHVGPYRCVIGRRTLAVSARQTFYDGNGHKLAAEDPALVSKAYRVAESNLTWSWR